MIITVGFEEGWDIAWRKEQGTTLPVELCVLWGLLGGVLELSY